MSRNGSGVYSLPAGNPVVTGTTISSTWANTTLSDIATALTGSVAADGQTAMTGNLQMGNNKITGLAVATASGDALSYGQAATISALTVSGAFAANGGATLGDASGDALTINSSAVSAPNGLNFNSNALVLNTSGNLGLGVTPNSWGAQAGNKAFQYLSGFVQGDSSGNAGIGRNAYQGDTWRYKANGYASMMNFETDGAFKFFTAPSGTAGNAITFTQAMTLDASGHLMVGATSNLNPISNYKTLQVSGTNGGIVDIGSTSTSYGRLSADSAGMNVEALVAGTPVFFRTGGTERMRIDSSGNLLVGYTSGGQNSFSGSVKANGYNVKAGADAALGGNVFNINWTGSPQLWIDTTNVGTIQLSSDYRIKRNIETQTAPALERVMALRPVTYQMADYGDLFKAGDAIKEGFIAHEVQEVIPSGAEGVKDDPNQIQSLRVDAILAVAVKAIQELKAEVDVLKVQVENK